MGNCKMIKYGIWHKKQKCLLGTYTESNSDGDFCVSVQYTLTTTTSEIWLTDSYKHAEYIRTTNTDWYNADYDSPSNPYKSKELKVVKLQIFIDTES